MKKKLRIRKLREFAFFMSLALPLFVGLIYPTLRGHSFNKWTILTAIPFSFLGIFKPILLKKPYIFWINIGNLLGKINGFIVLGFIFIFVLQPIALIMRLFGYDPLRKKRTNKKSYRELKKNNKIDLTRIF